MLAAGNTVVFNVHPSAPGGARSRRSRCSTRRSVRPAARRTSSPASPSRPSRRPRQLMKHRAIRLLVVTGGGGVVKAAMASGKRAICAGPGNPPVVVDETADIDKAGAGHRARRLVRQQHHLHRREGGAGRRPAWPTPSCGRWSRPARCWSTSSRLPQLEKVVFSEVHGPAQGRRRQPRARSARTLVSSSGRSASTRHDRCAWRSSRWTRTTRSSGPSR